MTLKRYIATQDCTFLHVRIRKGELIEYYPSEYAFRVISENKEKSRMTWPSASFEENVTRYLQSKIFLYVGILK
jgi:hypothetical protein